MLTLNGGDDNDTFIIQAFALIGSQEDERALTDLSGDAGADLIQYAVNAPVQINGGDGLDTVIIIGTEFGVFVTIDGGKSWSRFRENLPPVAVHDLVIHPRDADLVAGTHGRSIWIADDITPLQQLTEEVLQSEVYLFENRIATKWSNITKGRIQNYFKFRGDNPPPGASINFYLRTAPTDSVRVVVEDPFSERRRTITVAGNAGINRARWDLRFFPNEEQIQAHRALLRGILDTTATLVREARGADVLDQMRKDLLATQRYPNRYDDADYPETNDARTLLLDHLRHIGVRLDRAATYRDLFQVREQLLAYSHVMGDRAFFGFYGEELTATTAAAARYTVTVTVDGTSYVGKVTVRDDPLKRN